MAHWPSSPRFPALGLLAFIVLVTLVWSTPHTGALDAPVTQIAATGPTAVTPVPMRVFFGTSHSHTGAYNNHGQDNSDARDIFETAKAYNFDFLLLTEHSGPSGPANPVEFYADAQAQAAAVTQQDVFVGLAGYEYSDNGGDGDTDHGHLTVYGTDEFVNAVAPGMTFEALYDYLVTQSAEQSVFAGYNHPPSRGHPASAPRYLQPDVRRVVPLTEGFNGFLHAHRTGRSKYQSFVAHLDRGWRVAPTCGLDSHGMWRLKQTESENTRPCRTGVLAPRLNTGEVVRAIMARRVYASADINLRARYTANDRWMGGLIGQPARVRLDIRLFDPNTVQPRDRITGIQVVGRGGRVLAGRSFDAHQVRWQLTVDRGRNTYLFVRVLTGDDRQLTAILAPVWFR